VNNAWLVPAVIVAATGVAVQGVKAAWDLVMSVRNHAHAQSALRLQEVSALMHLVDGLPLPSARKALWKVELAKLIEKRAEVSQIYSTLDKLIRESVESPT
jgi:hypothetical protein